MATATKRARKNASKIATATTQALTAVTRRKKSVKVEAAPATRIYYSLKTKRRVTERWALRNPDKSYFELVTNDIAPAAAKVIPVKKLAARKAPAKKAAKKAVKKTAAKKVAKKAVLKTRAR